MVQGWSRGVLYRGAAQFTLRWNAQNTSKQLDEIHKTLQSNSPIPKYIYIYIQLYTHRFLVTHLLLRFHKSAEEKMKTATYVSNPQKGLKCYRVKLPSSIVQWEYCPIPTVLGSPRCATASGVEMKIRTGRGLLSVEMLSLVSFILFIQPMPHTVYVGTQKSSTKRRTPLAAHRFVRVAVMMEMRKLNRMPNVLENLVVPSLRPNRHLRPTKRSKTSVLEKNDHCMSRTCSAGSWGYCAPMGSCDIYPTHQITPPNLFYICGTTIKKILF